MESATSGLVGGILGACIGLVGAAIGVYFSIKNTNGPKERAFMMKFGGIVSVLFIVLLVLLLLVPPSYKMYVWVPYLLLLYFAIRHGNKRQQKIREEEWRANRESTKA